jgi:hypothetical protein
MRLYPLCLLLLLSACISPAPEPVMLLPHVPPGLLQPCLGYRGPVPVSEGQISDALLAEAIGRDCANNRLATLNKIIASND